MVTRMSEVQTEFDYQAFGGRLPPRVYPHVACNGATAERGLGLVYLEGDRGSQKHQPNTSFHLLIFPSVGNAQLMPPLLAFEIRFLL